MKIENVPMVYVVSLGCPKNFVDTEVMVGSFFQHQYGITVNPEDATVFLINTCGFIPPAREEAEDYIREACNWKSGEMDRWIVVTGCLVQWDSEGVYRARYPDVDLWLGPDEIKDCSDHLNSIIKKESSTQYICNAEPSFIYDETTPRMQLTLPHYSYLKISDGCNNCCSYCSIPRIRGKLRSRQISSIVKEARSLVEQQVKELILIAQDTTFYGDDISESSVNIVELIKALDCIEGDHWIRLLYTHPASFTDELIEAIAGSEHILPYIGV